MCILVWDFRPYQRWVVVDSTAAYHDVNERLLQQSCTMRSAYKTLYHYVTGIHVSCSKSMDCWKTGRLAATRLDIRPQMTFLHHAYGRVVPVQLPKRTTLSKSAINPSSARTHLTTAAVIPRSGEAPQRFHTAMWNL